MAARLVCSAFIGPNTLGKAFFENVPPPTGPVPVGADGSIAPSGFGTPGPTGQATLALRQTLTFDLVRTGAAGEFLADPFRFYAGGNPVWMAAALQAAQAGWRAVGVNGGGAGPGRQAGVRPLVTQGGRDWQWVTVDGHPICEVCGAGVIPAPRDRWRHVPAGRPFPRRSRWLQPVTWPALRRLASYQEFHRPVPVGGAPRPVRRCHPGG